MLKVFWKSYGSYVVWNKGDVNPKSISDIEKNAPQLLRPFERSIMMEYAYHSPMPMWLAVPLSTKKGDDFIFDKQKIFIISKISSLYMAIEFRLLGDNDLPRIVVPVEELVTGFVSMR